MSVDLRTLVAIFAMGLGVMACRLGGYWLFTRIKPSAALQKMLSYIPGTLFVSYVAPTIVAGGLKEWVGAAVAVVAAILTKSMLWPVLAGTGVAWGIWLIQTGA